MGRKKIKILTRIMCALLIFCMTIATASGNVYAQTVVNTISVTANNDYQVGETPRASASLSSGSHCHVAYEVWRELEKDTSGLWQTKKSWYSDANKMASLNASETFTQFEAGKKYNYDIVLETDSGYTFASTDDLKLTFNHKERYLGGGTGALDQSKTQLTVKQVMDLTLKNASSQAPIGTAIQQIDVGNVWKNFDTTQPIAYTGEVNPNSVCSQQMELFDEMWYSDGGVVLKRSDNASVKPIENFGYYYAFTLKAKDGYYFSDDFTNGWRYKTSASSSQPITFIFDGHYALPDTISYWQSGAYFSHYDVTLSSDQKTLTMHVGDFYVKPTTGGNQADVIKNIEINGATLSYQAGEKPVATAKRGDENAPNYQIAYEYIEEMEKKSDGSVEPVKYWYSDTNKNNSLAADKKITTFEAGKTYMYSLSLEAINGRTFASPNQGLSLKVNGKTIAAQNITVSSQGTSLFVTAIQTIKPVQRQALELVEITGATLSFKAGDQPLFTGKVNSALYEIDHEGWSTEDYGVTSSDYWNKRYGNFEGSWGQLLTTFEANKEYTYHFYVKLTDEAVKQGYYFDKEKTKVSLNGQIMDIDLDSINIDKAPYDDVAWFNNVYSFKIATTPTNSSTGETSKSDKQTSSSQTATVTPTTKQFSILKEENKRYVRNQSQFYAVEIDHAFTKDLYVEIDGHKVDSQYYTITKGSTIVTLKDAYMKTLSNGKHTIVVHFQDGQASSAFTIVSSPVNTSDSFSILPYVSLMMLAGVGYIELKKRRS